MGDNATADDGGALEMEIISLEKHAQVVNLSISLMLLAGISFNMFTFYMTNHHDDDIRRTSWIVLSTTLSIFASVLLFSAIQGVYEYYIVQRVDPASQVVLYLAEALFYFILLQWILAASAGSLWKRPQVAKIDSEKLKLFEKLKELEDEILQRPGSLSQAELEEEDLKIERLRSELTNKHNEEIETHNKSLALDLKCGALMIGHINAFAANAGFGAIQQVLSPTWYIVGTIPFLSYFVYVCLFEVSSCARSFFVRRRRAQQDQEATEQDHLYFEEVAETENDIIGINVSWLTVATLRLIIAKDMPDLYGAHDVSFNKSLPLYAPYVMIATGLGVGIVLILKTIFIKEMTYFKRTHKYIGLIIAMVSSWSLQFGVDYFLMYYLGLEQAGAECEVLGAMICTFVSFALIFLLDKLADSATEQVSRGLRAFINGLGILIGSSWEGAFDGCIEGLSDDSYIPGLPGCWIRLIIAVVLFVLVVPAWKWYILRVILHNGWLEEEEEEEGEEGHEEHKHQSEGLVSKEGENEVEQAESEVPPRVPSQALSSETFPSLEV